MNAKSVFAAAIAVALAVSALPASAAPRSAPDFTWASSGRTVHLKDLHGHLVVVNFFASWCGPCREETPEFVKIADEYSSRGVYFVGVDSGEESVEQVTKFAVRYGIDYQLVVDTKDLIQSAYAVSALPTTFIINTNGAVIFHTVGSMAGDDLTGALDAFLSRAR
jgi:thiol-disulfide isomerase/thioredoxin